MRFVCSGRNRNSFKLLYDKVSDEGDGFFFYEKGLELLNSLSSIDGADALIFLDEEIYKGFLGFVYDFLRVKDWKIPILMIGETIFSETHRAEKWVAENEFQYDIQTLHLLVPVLRKISSALDCHEFRKNFVTKNTMLFERVNPVETQKIRKNNLNPVESLRRALNLPPTVFNLFHFLFVNRCREVGVEEIEKLLQLKVQSEKTRKNSAYSYISRLKKCIEKVQNFNFRVIRTRKGFYKLVAENELEGNEERRCGDTEFTPMVEGITLAMTV